MRQHVNPLSQFFQLPLSLPSKNILFEKSHYPIHLDIGSAKGEFLIELATKYPDWNFVGLEIREPLVSLCEKKRRKYFQGGGGWPKTRHHTRHVSQALDQAMRTGGAQLGSGGRLGCHCSICSAKIANGSQPHEPNLATRSTN